MTSAEISHSPGMPGPSTYSELQAAILLVKHILEHAHMELDGDAYHDTWHAYLVISDMSEAVHEPDKGCTTESAYVCSSCFRSGLDQRRA